MTAIVSKVYVVYGSKSALGPEPVIAVVSDENQARAIEADVVSRHPEAVVRWETLDLQGHDTQSVSILFALAGDSPDADPIGLAAFARKEDAEIFRRSVKGDVPHEVRSYPLGWRVASWPFA